MKYATTRSVGTRVVTHSTRMTLDKADDTTLLQQTQLRGMHSESMDTIEVAHPYGFSAVAKGPTMEGGVKKRAEVFVNFLGGDRSHGVVHQISDRRYRPNNLQEGEVVNHDDQGQQVYLSRDRIVVNAPAGKEVHVQTADGAHVLCTKDKTKMQFGNMSVTIKGGNVYLGKEGITHAVGTLDGPSTNVFCTIDETDTPMTAAPTATRTQKPATGQGGQTGTNN